MLRFLFDGWARWQSERRKIFFYRAGSKACRIDPITAVRLLQEAEPKWEQLLGTISHTIPDILGPADRERAESARTAAVTRMVEAGRKVFDLKPLTNDGRGVTEAEVFGTVTAFVMFMGRLAAAAAPFSPSPGRASIPAVT